MTNAIPILLSLLISAPAPFWKEDKEVERHPSVLAGWYAFNYHGSEYEADVCEDGTFRIKPKGKGRDFQWRGTWGVKAGVMYWREWEWHKLHTCSAQWCFKFKQGGVGWQDGTVTLQYLWFVRPTD